MTDTAEDARPRLQAEELAAIANACFVLASPFLVSMIFRWNEPERAVAVAWVSGPPPDPVARWFAHVATTMVPVAPFAAVAAWRTHVHARLMRVGQGHAWQGVGEAAALGALVPMVLLLPIVAMRGLAGLAYVSAYGVLGALVGTTFGLVLAAVAMAVVQTSRRLSHRA